MPRYAAVDIGSNSVRLEIAGQMPGSPLHVLASQRQVTRLGESVFRSGRISADAWGLTCEVLERMAGVNIQRVIATPATAAAGVRDGVIAGLVARGTGRERNGVANLCRYHRKSMPTALHANYQSLPPEDQRVVMLLSPLPGLADALDRSRRQIVQSLSCQIGNAEVKVEPHSEENPDLDLWAGERVADLFRPVYAYRLALAKARR